MFLAAFDRVEKLLSREFLIASYFPWVIFAALNLLLYELVHQEAFSPTRWFLAQTADRQALAGGIVLFALAVFAYVWTPLLLQMRQLMEGRFLPPGIQTLLRRGQRDRLWARKQRINGLRVEIRALQRLDGRLTALLTQARARGERRAAPGTGGAATLRQARRAVSGLWDQHDLVGIVERCVRLAVARTLRALRANPASRVPEVEDLLAMLRDSLTYLRHRADQEYRSRFNERDAAFPRDDLAPSAMGNFAEAVRSYAFSRHGLDLGFFWQRLQLVLRNDAALMGQLREAKTHLDFLVLLFWLTTVFTLVWGVLLAVFSGSLPLYLGVGLIGPLLMLILYRLALASYAILGDLTRSAIDLHRFDLLTALKQKLPADSESEQKLWQELQRALAYGEGNKIGFPRGDGK